MCRDAVYCALPCQQRGQRQSEIRSTKRAGLGTIPCPEGAPPPHPSAPIVSNPSLSILTHSSTRTFRHNAPLKIDSYVLCYRSRLNSQ